jgi:eukaryotic-like serine/threonine-protein kinase
MSQFTPRPQRIRQQTQSEKAPRKVDSRNQKRKKALIRLGYVAVSAIALFVILNSIVMPIVIRHGDSFELENIVGMSFDEATELIDERGLRIEVTSQEYNPSYRDGSVLTQYPTAGTKVKSGRMIKVVVSLGEKDVIIPKITGMSVRQAKLDLETASLRLGDIAWTYTDTLPEKLVVFTFPSAGDTVSIGSKVNILVNRGRGQGVTYMPDLIGSTIDEAREVLRQKGLKIGLIRSRHDENFLPETILEQSENPATELEVGEEIDLVVSVTE